MSTLIKITDISEFVKEESLKKLVSFLGELRHLSFKRTKASTFECVVDFIHPEDARLALHLDGTLFLDRILKLDLYRDEDQLNRIARTIRVDNVQPDISLEQFKEFFSNVEGVRRMRMGNGIDKETQLGYIYVEFTTFELAQKAMRDMDQQEFHGHALRITPSRIAISKGKTSTKTGSPAFSASKVRERGERDRENDYDRRERAHHESRHDTRERKRSRGRSRDSYHRDHSYDRKRRRER